MLQKINTGEQNLELIQANVDKELTKLQTAPLSGGVLLSNLALSAGTDNLIAHNLGYAPTMILPLAPNANVTIWSPKTSNLANSNVSATQVNLRCSSGCTVSVWVK